ncbi:MAG: hypothetical protein SFX74_09105 [Fimbriimonadaceae bacterium]|nr:hypothetical protein [Fimbriimonadaceae bacterium]
MAIVGAVLIGGMAGCEAPPSAPPQSKDGSIVSLDEYMKKGQKGAPQRAPQ